jgi:hypothetical protein
MIDKTKSNAGKPSSETQLAALGLYFRAALGGAEDYKTTEIRYLHDVPKPVADYVRQALQDKDVDDLVDYSNQGDALISLSQVDWNSPGIFGPKCRTFYLEVIDQEGGTFFDSLLSVKGEIIATWGGGS